MKLPFSRIGFPKVGPSGGLNAAEYRTAFLAQGRDPVYPTGATAGAVILDIVVGLEGSVQTVSARSGDPHLAEAAGSAIRDWKFRTCAVNGQPVEVATEMEVIFEAPALVRIV